MSKLTDKQEEFVQKLIQGNSQREAYKISYPNCKATDKTIDEKASKLFSMGKVRTRYNEIHDRLVKESEDECIVSVKDVLKELKSVAFANGADFANVVEKTYKKAICDGKGEFIGYEDEIYKAVDIKLTEDVSEEKLKAISSIKQGKNGIEIKTNDKVKALELIGKHLGMFKEKDEDKGSDVPKVVDDIG